MLNAHTDGLTVLLGREEAASPIQENKARRGDEMRVRRTIYDDRLVLDPAIRADDEAEDDAACVAAQGLASRVVVVQGGDATWPVAELGALVDLLDLIDRRGRRRLWRWGPQRPRLECRALPARRG